MHISTASLSGSFWQQLQLFSSSVRSTISTFAESILTQNPTQLHRPLRTINRLNSPSLAARYLKIATLLLMLDKATQVIQSEPLRVFPPSLPDLQILEENYVNYPRIATDYFPSSPNGTVTIYAQQSNGNPLPAGLSIVNSPISFLGNFNGFFPDFITQDGQYAYSLSGNSLMITQFTNPSNSVVLQASLLPSIGVQTCNSQICYSLANTYRPLCLSSIQPLSPLNPVITTVFSYSTPNSITAFSLDSYSETALLIQAVGSKSNLLLSNSTSLIRNMTLPLDYDDYVSISAISQDIVCLGTYDNTLANVKIFYLNLTSFLISNISLPAPYRYQTPDYMVIVGSACIFSTNSYPLTQGALVIDLSQPEVLNLASIILPNPSFLYILGLQYYDYYLYLTTGSGIYQINIDNIYSPYVVSQIIVPSLGSQQTFFGANLYTGGQIYSKGPSFSLIGTAAVGTHGNYSIELAAKDSFGNKVGNTLKINIQIAPALTAIQSLPPFVTLINNFFLYPLPATTFTTTNNLLIYYSASTNGNQTLPNGLSISSTTGTLYGTPTIAQRYSIVITATDKAGATASTILSLTVAYPITPGAASTNVLGFIDVPLNYTFSNSLFNNPGNEPLSYSLTYTGRPLPLWLAFNPETLTLLGTPSTANIGFFPLTLQAIDSNQLTASLGITLNIQPVTPPTLVYTLEDQTAHVGDAFTLQIPSTLFLNPTRGELSLNINSLPGWLQYDQYSQLLTGTPHSTDQPLTGEAFYQISLTGLLTFPNSNVTSTATTTFKVTLVGDSVFEEALTALGYASAGVSLLLFLYRNRKYYYTHCRHSFLKRKISATVGEPFYFQFQTNRDLVQKVQLLFPRQIPYERCNKFRQWLSENLERIDIASSCIEYDSISNSLSCEKMENYNTISSIFFIRALNNSEVVLEEVEATFKEPEMKITIDEVQI